MYTLLLVAQEDVKEIARQWDVYHHAATDYMIFYNFVIKYMTAAKKFAGYSNPNSPIRGQLDLIECHILIGKDSGIPYAAFLKPVFQHVRFQIEEGRLDSQEQTSNNF